MNKSCVALLEKVELKIKKTVSNIPLHDREDVEQDLKEKICLSTDKIDYDEVPGFFEFIEKEVMKGAGETNE
ncbi:hypothetical protein MKX54_20415 [Alkalihalobacillus sp. FSL R5-0424]